MPRSAPSNEQIGEFRNRAVECATSLFLRGGLGALTMRGIAQELGCSAMTPHRYFENLEENYFHGSRPCVRAFCGFARTSFFSQGTDAESRLLNLKQAYIRFAVEEPQLYTVMFQIPREARAQLPRSS